MVDPAIWSSLKKLALKGKMLFIVIMSFTFQISNNANGNFGIKALFLKDIITY